MKNTFPKREIQLCWCIGGTGEGMKTTWISDVQAGSYDGKDVELKGWIKRSRGSNKIRFIVLRDSTGTIQCVAKRDTVGDECFEELKSALIEASVIIKGTVNPDERADGGHELIVKSAEIVGHVNPRNTFSNNRICYGSSRWWRNRIPTR